MCSEWTKITNWSVSSFQEEDDGYDILELTVKRTDKRVLTVIRLPLLVTFLIVILWNFSILPITYTVIALVVLVLGTYLHAWNTIVEGMYKIKPNLNDLFLSLIDYKTVFLKGNFMFVIVYRNINCH